MVVIGDDDQIRCTNPAAEVLFASGDLTGRSTLDFCIPGHPRSDLETAAIFAGEMNQPEGLIMIRLDSGRRLRVLMREDAVTPPSGGLLYLVQLREVATAVADGTAPAESGIRPRTSRNTGNR